jgi:hypothetical protein
MSANLVYLHPQNGSANSAEPPSYTNERIAPGRQVIGNYLESASPHPIHTSPSKQAPQAQIGTTPMDDKDVQRLEDRIAASEERAQLRLEMLGGKIEGAVTRIGDQVGTIRQDLQEQRQDARTARVELFDQLKEQARDLSSRLKEQGDRDAAHFYWLMGTIIAAVTLALVVILAIGQIWGNGVQVGQSIQQPPQSATPSRP